MWRDIQDSFPYCIHVLDTLKTSYPSTRSLKISKIDQVKFPQYLYLSSIYHFFLIVGNAFLHCSSRHTHEASFLSGTSSSLAYLFPYPLKCPLWTCTGSLFFLFEFYTSALNSQIYNSKMESEKNQLAIFKIFNWCWQLEQRPKLNQRSGHFYSAANAQKLTGDYTKRLHQVYWEGL